MAVRRKKTRRTQPQLVTGVAKVASFKLPGVDLGTLQSEFVGASRALKSAGTKLANAQDTFDASRAAYNVASEKLKAASRAVLADS